MGLILDSSVVIDAERRGDTVEQFIEKIACAANRASAGRGHPPERHAGHRQMCPDGDQLLEVART